MLGWDKKNVLDLAFLLAELKEACSQLSLNPKQFITSSLVPTHPLPSGAPPNLWCIDKQGNCLFESNDFTFLLTESVDYTEPDAKGYLAAPNYNTLWKEKREREFLVRVGVKTLELINNRVELGKSQNRNEWLLNLIIQEITK